MLRVGLTGELGSGKSTVARLLAGRGAVVMSSDEMGRALMQPGEPVYQAIVDRFGSSVVGEDGTLDRRALARLAFDPAQSRIEELNALIHPAVLAEQQRRVAQLQRTDPGSIVVIESALLFTTRHSGGAAPWATRFDCIVLVTAPDESKLARFVERATGGSPVSESARQALLEDAGRRLAAQRIPPADAARCLLVRNGGDIAALESKVAMLWEELQKLARTKMAWEGQRT